ncbi:Uncharacterized protein M6B38_245725 [Iris pallida]|uniref:Uncharacterized protein n=1 Tax=Iris pallida TaxID=29817 RepID=A0AAX6DHC1_IRIPA|nr:Uncharacterized protein M6B38_245725 [Iris pallida]
MASSLLFSSSPLPFSFTPQFPLNSRRVLSLRKFPANSRTLTLTVSFALAESDSAKSVDDTSGDILPLLQELAENFQLPPDYLAKLPRDLRIDLNDAAFYLSNGPVMDECGQEMGELLLNLSRAWEQADTSTSNSITGQIPSLVSSLTSNVKPAFGRRLVSAGRKFQSMGQYGQGELQRDHAKKSYAGGNECWLEACKCIPEVSFNIAKAMIKIGKVLSSSSVVKIDEKPKEESRVLKFGDLQVELTAEKAYIGAAIAVVFGLLSWELSQGIQSIPESSLQYANDNALQLGKSLRGALLVTGYASTILCASSSVGLLLLARQLKSRSESEDP